MIETLTHLPDISIVVCSYNHGKWIERCIRSLTHQKYISPEEYEIILVDDGSRDNTSSVLKNLDCIINLRIIRNETNLGLPASLNKAIQNARGRYIMRVDSDDYIARETFFFLKFFLDKNRYYQAVACDYLRVSSIEENGIRMDAVKDEISCGIMYRKECLFDIGLYNEEFFMREGHELRRRFLKKFRIGHLELPLYKYRDHDGNRTKNIEEVVKFDHKLNRKE